MTRRRAAVLAFALLAACAPAPAPEQGRFVVGEPYQMGGTWSYPREDYALAESGLAVVLPDTRRGRRTANGEIHDPAALVAAHRTLQLPAVVLVWNLESGREVRVRVHDRGPEAPGRVIGLSRRAAELLGVRPNEPAKVRIAVDPELSRAVAGGLPGAEGPRLAIATAPLAAVDREQLAPPPGARGGGGGHFGAARPILAASDTLGAPSVPRTPTMRLGEGVTQRGVLASRLMVDAGFFFRRDLAERRAAALGGRAEALGTGRRPQYGVRLGPFATVAEADRALDAALRHGVADARLVLE